jgi:cell division protein FtsQ
VSVQAADAAFGRRAAAETAAPRSGGILFMLLLAAAFTAAAVYLADPRALPIRYVRVNGDFRHLSPAHLERVAGEVVRGGFFNVNVETVRATLLAEPWVKDVTVRRTWPDGLALYVREQVPVARWGDLGLLNRDAGLFTPAEDTWPAGLPVLTGPEGTEGLVLERWRLVQQELGRYGLSAVSLELSDRRAWSLVLDGGTRVVLGRRDFVGRFERLTALLGAGLAGELHRIETMDMRYTNGLAVRWKESAAEDSITERGGHGAEN